MSGLPPAEVQRGEGLQDQGLSQQRDSSLAAKPLAGLPGEVQAAVEVPGDEPGPAKGARQGRIPGISRRPLGEPVDHGRAAGEGADQRADRHDPGVKAGQREGPCRLAYQVADRFGGRTPVARHGRAEQQVAGELLLARGHRRLGGLDKAPHRRDVAWNAVIECALKPGQPREGRRVEGQGTRRRHELVNRIGPAELEGELGCA